MQSAPRSRSPANEEECLNRLPVSFSISELAESWHIAARFADVGMTLAVDLTGAGFPEVLVVGLSGVKLYRVWRTSVDFGLQFLLPEQGGNRINLPTIVHVWATIIYLTNLPHDVARKPSNPSFATDRLPAWLREVSAVSRRKELR